jgi:hypothetical protein
MSRRNGDRARFQRQRQARLLRRKRVAALIQRLKVSSAASAATVPAGVKTT